MIKPKRPDDAPRATNFVESLDRGLRLLQAFGMRPSPMTLSEIAALAGLPRATARRILFTLQHGGYVSSDGKLFAPTGAASQLTYWPFFGHPRSAGAPRAGESKPNGFAIWKTRLDTSGADPLACIQINNSPQMISASRFSARA